MDGDQREEISRTVILHAAIHICGHEGELCSCFMERWFRKGGNFADEFWLEYNDYVYDGDDNPESIKEAIVDFLMDIHNEDIQYQK